MKDYQVNFAILYVNIDYMHTFCAMLYLEHKVTRLKYWTNASCCISHSTKLLVLVKRH